MRPQNENHAAVRVVRQTMHLIVTSQEVFPGVVIGNGVPR